MERTKEAKYEDRRNKGKINKEKKERRKRETGKRGKEE